MGDKKEISSDLSIYLVYYIKRYGNKEGKKEKTCTGQTRSKLPESKQWCGHESLALQTIENLFGLSYQQNAFLYD